MPRLKQRMPVIKGVVLQWWQRRYVTWLSVVLIRRVKLKSLIGQRAPVRSSALGWPVESN